MPDASDPLPAELGRAVEALGRTVTGQLRDQLDGAGRQRNRLAEEFRRRSEDYRTWYRMQEVPDRVAAIAGRLVTGEPECALRRALDLAVLDALARAHRDALTGEPPRAGYSGQ